MDRPQRERAIRFVFIQARLALDRVQGETLLCQKVQFFLAGPASEVETTVALLIVR